MPCAFCIIIWMKRKDLASYLILAILIFIAFTFLWNYQTTLPWLKGILMPVAIPMLLGICIGFVLNMPASAIEKRINGVRHCRGISIAVSIILLALAAVLFLAIVVPELVNAISLLIDALRDLANNQALWDTRLAEIPLIGSFLEEADTQILTIADKIESYISSISPTIISFAISKVGEFISFWITLFISFIFAVYFLANKEMLKKHIKALLSLVMDEKTLSYLSHTAAVSSEAFTRFITAQVTEALIIGVLCFIGMLILRLPYAPVISTLTGVMALIPIYGILSATGMVLPPMAITSHSPARLAMSAFLFVPHAASVNTAMLAAKSFRFFIVSFFYIKLKNSLSLHLHARKNQEAHKCSIRIFVPRPIKTSPPIISILKFSKRRAKAPKRLPATDIANETAPMMPTGNSNEPKSA